MSQYPVAAKILRRMRASRGAVFSATDFLDLGSRAAIDQALARVTRDGKARRLGRGLYDVPRKSRLIGLKAPSTDSIAAAIARKSAARLAPTGAQAANNFGLSTQVPAQARYLTDGEAKTIHVGKRTIRFDQVTPRRLAGSPVSRAVIEALRHLGRDQITIVDISRIRDSLSTDDRCALQADIHHAPDWMRPMLTSIVADDSVANPAPKKRRHKNG